MAHLVEIYEGLSRARKAKPIETADLSRVLLGAYIENVAQRYEKLRRTSVSASSLVLSSLSGESSPSTSSLVQLEPQKVSNSKVARTRTSNQRSFLRRRWRRNIKSLGDIGNEPKLGSVFIFILISISISTIEHSWAQKGRLKMLEFQIFSAFSGSGLKYKYKVQVFLHYMSFRLWNFQR